MKGISYTLVVKGKENCLKLEGLNISFLGEELLEDVSSLKERTFPYIHVRIIHIAPVLLPIYAVAYSRPGAGSLPG
jgi:hypothetical protein